MLRPLYRCRQVLHALRPRLDDGDLDFARGVLSQSEASLFFGMELRDQRHALEVAKWVRRAEDRSLLVAALLHDCGKGSVPVWLRVLHVLSPAATGRLGAAGARGWRGAAYRLRHHAELGAARAREAGCSETTARLIEGRVEPDEAWQYELLLAADDVS